MRKGHVFAALALELCILSICSYGALSQSPSVQIINDEQTYAPGKSLEGLVNIKLSEFMPEGQLKACISSSCSQINVNLSEAKYQFRQYTFTYKINANGKNEWYQYPEKAFSFQVKAEGTCGNAQCHALGTCECNDLCLPPSSPPYSCQWEIRSSVFSSTANENWRSVLDAGQVITPPQDKNADIVYTEIANNFSLSKVQTTMRATCGDMGQIWIQKTLQGFVGIPGGTKSEVSIGPFDDSSLATNRQMYVDGSCSQPYVCGGIYMDGQLLTAGYTANGTTGKIIVDSYNPMATYIMVYLPANGPLVCSRSTYRILNSTTWEASSSPQAGYVSYDKIFSKTYTQNELPYTFTGSSGALVTPPDCPLKSPEEMYVCTKKVISYYASKTSDSSGGSIVFSFNEGARTASASISSPDLTQELVKAVNLSEFQNLRAPSSPGEYNLQVTFSSGGYDLASDYATFAVCHDSDKDGWCREAGCAYCGDCNDTNPSVYPGKIELCNGIDDNCDGVADEIFQIAGKKIGTGCGVGICNGTWVCSPDKKSVICNSVYSPGQLPEICGNSLDDDCDGVVDELYETNQQGVVILGCVCKDGEKKPCGSNVGECRQGNQVCVQGEWTKCLSSSGPTEEACNGKDDDCDGITDNLGDSTDPSETLCACTDQKPGDIQEIMAETETCGNGMDDNCDGQMDEGCICASGETKPCGNNKGICRAVQACTAGQWGECEVTIGPDPEGEICYNNIDDNCNGKVDDYCIPEFTCKNGRQDLNEDGVDCGNECSRICDPPGIPYGLILLACGVILLIAVFAISVLRNKA